MIMMLISILIIIISLVYSKKIHVNEINDDDSSDSMYYSYNSKSIIYDKSYSNLPTNIYTNYDGNVVIVGDQLGSIMRSTNHGKSWDTDKTLYNGTDYLSIVGLVMNEDGNEMLVSTSSNMIFYSNDYGATFNIRSRDRECSIMAASNDLKKVSCIGGAIAATTATTATLFGDDDGPVDVNHNHIYYSEDGGYNWSKSDAKNARWVGLLSNQDGSWIVGIVKHKLKYVWASSDGGKTYSCINDEERNDWGCLAGSKDLQTMIMTDTVSRNVHISMDYGYTWTQVYDGANLDKSITINSCAVSANSYEGTATNIALAIGFTGTSMKVVYSCDPHTEHEHCADMWLDTGDLDTDANTYSQALSKDGKYFYSIDSNTMKCSLGYRTYT